MNSIIARAAGAVLALSIILCCAGDKPTQPEESNNTGKVVTPAATSGQSMGWIALAGLPTDSGNYYGIVTPKPAGITASVTTDTGFAAIVRADSGDFMIVPLYPSGSSYSGDVQIVFTDGGDYVSDPIVISVDSLPAAPGEFAAVVALLQDVLTENLVAAGLTRDSLAYATGDDVPLSRLPLVLAYGVIDDPGNPNSLRALADGTAPILNGDTLKTDVLDRILAETGLRTYFETLVADLDTTTVAYLPGSNGTPDRADLSSSQACIPAPDYGITSCDQLAAAMNLQYTLATAAKSASQKVINDGIKAGLAVASLFPGVAVETAALGAIVWGDAVVKEGQQNMLPSEFIDEATTFDPSEKDFNEDFMVDGHWSEFMVTATSQGWTLDKVALEALMQAVGGITVSNGPPGLTDDINGALKGIATGEVQGKAIEKFADATGSVKVCPNTWTNINCVGVDHSTVTSNTGVLDIDSVGLKYKPREVGSDIMRIETKNIFGQDNNTGTAAVINANELTVFINPYNVVADTNQKVDFTSRVENADDPRVLFSLSGGGTLDSDNSEAHVTTPSSPWNPPLVLHARSISNTGLRAGKVDSDPREDSAYISFGGGEFALTPESSCLAPSNTKNFAVVAVSGIIDSVRWYAEPDIGTIAPDGSGMVYTAPDYLAGLVNIYAFVNGKDTLQSTVEVSDCTCFWTFNCYLGDFSGHLSIANDLGFGGLIVTFDQAKGNNDPPSVSFTLTGFEGAGTYDSVNVLFTDPGTDPSKLHLWAHADTSVAMPKLTVSEYVAADHMAGSIVGELHQAIEGTDPVEYRRLSFSMSFRAEIAGGVNETICSGN